MVFNSHLVPLFGLCLRGALACGVSFSHTLTLKIIYGVLIGSRTIFLSIHPFIPLHQLTSFHGSNLCPFLNRSWRIFYSLPSPSTQDTTFLGSATHCSNFWSCTSSSRRHCHQLPTTSEGEFDRNSDSPCLQRTQKGNSFLYFIFLKFT